MEAADVLGGRYRLAERLGEGGMSVVWRAHDDVLGRSVAVKVLSSRFMADWTSRERIRAEAQAVARLSHPNVAGVYDYGESKRDDDGEPVPYVVMELLRGPSLAELLTDGPLKPAEALKICAEIAAALSAAHAVGIVHRDVKPANVMLTETGAKVVDFGVAAVIGDLSEHRPDAIVYGTPAYLAPERLEGGPVVPGTDVYALGLLLYRVLSGKMPWSVETTTQMLHAHMYVEPRPLPAIAGVAARVVQICRRCLAKDPGRRPMAADIAQLLASAAGISVPVVRPAVGVGSDGNGSATANSDCRVVAGPDPLTGAEHDGPIAGAAVGSGGTADGAAVGIDGAAVGIDGAAVGTGVATGLGRYGRGDRSSVRAPGFGPGTGFGATAAAIGARQTRVRQWALAAAAAAVLAAGIFVLSGGWPSARTGTATAQPGPVTNAPGEPRVDGAAGVGSSGSRTPDDAENVTRTGNDTPLNLPPAAAPAVAPPGPPAPTVVVTVTAPPADQEKVKVVDSPGGKVTARCVGRLASLSEETPADGFKVKATIAGPAASVGVRFVSRTQRVQVAVRCEQGEVVSTVGVTARGPNDEE